MHFETVIGLEIHAQMKTKSKIFCGCSTRFGVAPNENVCPVCSGMPGVLPGMPLSLAQLIPAEMVCPAPPFS